MKCWPTKALMATHTAISTRPASIIGRTPSVRISQPLASDGTYMPSRCSEMTDFVSPIGMPSTTCMLMGVAVMMKLITA